jgi:hypothetical protein
MAERGGKEGGEYMLNKSREGDSGGEYVLTNK